MFFGVDLVVGRRGGFGWLRKAKEADEGGDEGDLVRLFGDHDPESAGGSINSVLRLVLNPSSQFEEIRGRMEVFLLSELEELRTNVSANGEGKCRALKPLQKTRQKQETGFLISQ